MVSGRLVAGKNSGGSDAIPAARSPEMGVTRLDSSAVRKPRRRRGASSPTVARSSETLRRTGSKSYQGHRDELIALHGPVCAYCGELFPPDTLTLDHVQPRKGKTAYDRSDNLVLACKSCNAAKADMPFLGFILARRSRGVFLLHYGENLSDGIKQTVRGLVEKPL